MRATLADPPISARCRRPLLLLVLLLLLLLLLLLPLPAAAAAAPPAPPARAQEAGKIVLLGESGVGKTNLLSRLSNDEFNDDFAATIGVEFLTTVLEVPDIQRRVKAQIWDTAGQERFRSILSAYYRRARGAVLVFDASRPETLEHLEYWRTELLKKNEDNDELVLLLVGNKADLLAPAERAEAEAAGAAYAAKHGLAFELASAKSGENVKESFCGLMAAIFTRQAEAASGGRAGSVTLEQGAAALGRGGAAASLSTIKLDADPVAPKKSKCC